MIIARLDRARSSSPTFVVAHEFLVARLVEAHSADTGDVVSTLANRDVFGVERFCRLTNLL